MNRRINAAGLALVKQWEGFKTKAYRDVGGIWTVGYGHTSAAGAPTVKPNMVITEAEAEPILLADLATFEERVSRLVKVPLTDNQHAVLVSFDFNTGKLHSSTLLKKLNAGDYDAVPAELMKWVNAGGRRIKGLVNRRSAEAGLWAQGEFVSTNTQPATPKAPEVVTKENVSWAAGILSTVAFAFTGNGPLQWALAAILVVAFAIGAFLFIRNRLDPA
ncbi:lysozyme [Ensifer sp. LC163]|uniref:lysozyme n=1 Tax=Ensifer sp. LC163 TaxID=1120652 RepID=UPI000813A66B|nr:lysozyme [Ensifer sp. LC163]OCP36730.1 lysozyme [Ensifer sp. LC163]